MVGGDGPGRFGRYSVAPTPTTTAMTPRSRRPSRQASPAPRWPQRPPPTWAWSSLRAAAGPTVRRVAGAVAGVTVARRLGSRRTLGRLAARPPLLPLSSRGWRRGPTAAGATRTEGPADSELHRPSATAPPTKSPPTGNGAAGFVRSGVQAADPPALGWVGTAPSRVRGDVRDAKPLAEEPADEPPSARTRLSAATPREGGRCGAARHGRKVDGA